MAPPKNEVIQKAETFYEKLGNIMPRDKEGKETKEELEALANTITPEESSDILKIVADKMNDPNQLGSKDVIRFNYKRLEEIIRLREEAKISRLEVAKKVNNPPEAKEPTATSVIPNAPKVTPASFQNPNSLTAQKSTWDKVKDWTKEQSDFSKWSPQKMAIVGTATVGLIALAAYFLTRKKPEQQPSKTKWLLAIPVVGLLGYGIYKAYEGLKSTSDTFKNLAEKMEKTASGFVPDSVKNVATGVADVAEKAGDGIKKGFEKSLELLGPAATNTISRYNEVQEVWGNMANYKSDASFTAALVWALTKAGAGFVWDGASISLSSGGNIIECNKSFYQKLMEHYANEDILSVDGIGDIVATYIEGTIVYATSLTALRIVTLNKIGAGASTLWEAGLWPIYSIKRGTAAAGRSITIARLAPDFVRAQRLGVAGLGTATRLNITLPFRRAFMSTDEAGLALRWHFARDVMEQLDSAEANKYLQRIRGIGPYEKLQHFAIEEFKTYLRQMHSKGVAMPSWLETARLQEFPGVPMEKLNGRQLLDVINRCNPGSTTTPPLPTGASATLHAASTPPNATPAANATNNAVPSAPNSGASATEKAAPNLPKAPAASASEAATDATDTTPAPKPRVPNNRLNPQASAPAQNPVTPSSPNNRLKPPPSSPTAAPVAPNAPAGGGMRAFESIPLTSAANEARVDLGLSRKLLEAIDASPDFARSVASHLNDATDPRTALNSLNALVDAAPDPLTVAKTLSSQTALAKALESAPTPAASASVAPTKAPAATTTQPAATPKNRLTPNNRITGMLDEAESATEAVSNSVKKMISQNAKNADEAADALKGAGIFLKVFSAFDGLLTVYEGYQLVQLFKEIGRLEEKQSLDALIQEATEKKKMLFWNHSAAFAGSAISSTIGSIHVFAGGTKLAGKLAFATTATGTIAIIFIPLALTVRAGMYDQLADFELRNKIQLKDRLEGYDELIMGQKRIDQLWDAGGVPMTLRLGAGLTSATVKDFEKLNQDAREDIVLAMVGNVLKRTSPDAYEKLVQKMGENGIQGLRSNPIIRKTLLPFIGKEFVRAARASEGGAKLKPEELAQIQNLNIKSGWLFGKYLTDEVINSIVYDASQVLEQFATTEGNTLPSNALATETIARFKEVKLTEAKAHMKGAFGRDAERIFTLTPPALIKLRQEHANVLVDYNYFKNSSLEGLRTFQKRDGFARDEKEMIPLLRLRLDTLNEYVLAKLHQPALLLSADKGIRWNAQVSSDEAFLKAGNYSLTDSEVAQQNKKESFAESLNSEPSMAPISKDQLNKDSRTSLWYLNVAIKRYRRVLELRDLEQYEQEKKGI